MITLNLDFGLKWRLDLGGKTLWIIGIGQPQVAHRSVHRPEECPKQNVPNDDIVTVIMVGLLGQPGMMPAVQLGAAYYVIQPTKAHISIAVLEESIHAVKNQMQCNDLFRDSQQHKWKNIHHELQTLFERMKP